MHCSVPTCYQLFTTRVNSERNQYHKTVLHKFYLSLQVKTTYIIGKTRLTSTISIIYIMYLIESSLNVFICSQLRLVESELNTLTIHKFRDIHTKDIAQYDHCNPLLSIQFP